MNFFRAFFIFSQFFVALAIFVVNSKVRRLLKNTSASKMNFSVKDFCRISAEAADLVIYTEETLNGKFHFFVQ